MQWACKRCDRTFSPFYVPARFSRRTFPWKSATDLGHQEARLLVPRQNALPQLARELSFKWARGGSCSLTSSASMNELKRRIETRESRIGIVGMGYVGLPLALLFSEEDSR